MLSEPAEASLVLYEAADGVATLTLNRPDRLNTIISELIQQLLAALDRAQADAAVRTIRLRGAGRAFCAGYDIGWGAEVMQSVEREGIWDPVADYALML